MSPSRSFPRECRAVWRACFSAVLSTWFLALGLPLVTQAEQPLDQSLRQPSAIGPSRTTDGAGTSATTSAAGGGANADFDSLIDLIVSTVATESWAETGGGNAEIREFPTGVLVDASGTLQLRRLRERPTDDLERRRGTGPPTTLTAGNPRRASSLRYVSLPRLEREIARRQDARQPLEVAMLTLAGLRRVEYVFIYPESGDLVLAGPAGDWYVDPYGRLLSVETDRPVVRLDDLLVLLRRAQQGPDSAFGCAITPRQEALAQTQAFLDATSGTPIQPGQRQAWLRRLRDTVGKQEIDVWGVDPQSRVARVLVEADYHMKLIGMGLVDGVDGVESYLDSIRLARGEAPPPMSVLRWWFTQYYESVRVSSAGDAYQLVGQGARVLSENELLAEQGRRVHTGQSDPLNRLFAERFTQHFEELSRVYPVYGELRNIFDVAVAVALIQADGLAERVDWKPTRLVDAKRLRLPQSPAPRLVETVVNGRVINRRHIVAGVSGGVRVDVAEVLRKPREVVSDGSLVDGRGLKPEHLQPSVWWWDEVAED